jgi:hypothetical protein
MIDQLRSARGAYFFDRVKRITKKAVHELFDDLLASAVNPSRPLFRIERGADGDVRYSALCFAHDRPVSFLEDGSGKVDRVHGFVLMVEIGSTVAVLRSGLDITAAFRRAHLVPVGRRSVETAIARHDAVFERLSLRNMAASRLALRSKTLESQDLENAIASAGTTRFIPQNYRVRRDDGSYTATPSTGRISMRAEKAHLAEAIAWVRDIVALLEDEVDASPFITRFARPAAIGDIAAGVEPTYFAVDVMALADAIWEDEDQIRLVREDHGVWRELDEAEVGMVLADLEPCHEVGSTASAGNYDLTDAAGATVGALRFNKATIALRKLELPSLAGVFVERTVFGVGLDPERIGIVRHVDAKDMFVVLFSDHALAYVQGSLFRDEEIVGGGVAFMRHLVAEPALLAATSEKGAFAAGQRRFTAGSVFRTVVDTVAREDVLVCDDLGDEWADFIGVATTTSPVTITFYHAKHGDPSLSASAFHEGVGQGIKNLGRLGMTGARMPTKHDGWDALYANGGVVTAIRKRIRGGSRDEVAAKIAEVAAAPDVQRRVKIVTSSLSRASVQAAFDAVQAGAAPQPHFVQLYWLLAGFFSSCTEVGAVGLVVCRP